MGGGNDNQLIDDLLKTYKKAGTSSVKTGY
jgi:hypothetical protein